MVKNKQTFYILSFTWGILMTTIGCIAAAVLLLVGIQPNKYGYCWHFEVGNGWGGLNLGPVLLTCKNASVYVKNHEHGHGLQNCKYGPYMIIIGLMSAVRYWYRELRYNRKGLTPTTTYESVWYEAEATKLGTAFMLALTEPKNN